MAIFFVCVKANELNKNAGRMNKSLICEIAIAHNYGSKKKKRSEREFAGGNKTTFTNFYFRLYSLYPLGSFFPCWPIEKIHTLKNNYGRKKVYNPGPRKKRGIRKRIEIHSKIAIIIRFRIAMSSFSCYFIIFSAAWIFHHFNSCCFFGAEQKNCI